MEALQTTWFVLLAFLVAGYAVLDGFDLGVGFWHLAARKDRDRRILLNAVGPVWDGNEVWLLTAGGALFAAFPPVYATALSGLYLAIVLVLLGLVFRAVSLEFRGKVQNARWRAVWDAGFGAGSVVAALLLGTACGNILRGLPLDPAGNHAGTFPGLLNPYSLLIGLLSLAMFATHGALYLALKTEGALMERAKGWAWRAWGAYLALFIAASVWSVASHPSLVANHLESPALFLVPASVLGALVAIPVALRAGAVIRAFVASSVSIVGLVATAGSSLFPDLVPALGDPDLGLTVYNASSSYRTLLTMLVMAAVGMPVVLLYTAYTYRTFRGKVDLGEESY